MTITSNMQTFNRTTERPSATQPSTSVQMLPVPELTLGLDVRVDDDPEQLTELAKSIAELGVLQPLVVCPRGRTFEVVAGRRRLAAARQAGLDEVPCIVRELDEDDRLNVAISENLHRRNLSAIELALGYAEMKRRGRTQTDIARKMGRTQAHVSQLLTLLTFPDDVRQAIHRGDVSYMNVLGNRARFRDGMPFPGTLTGGQDKNRKKSHAVHGDEAALVSYWRRRHDRLLGGLYALLKANPVEAGEYSRMVDKLIKLDTQPFPDAT